MLGQLRVAIKVTGVTLGALTMLVVAYIKKFYDGLSQRLRSTN